MSPFLNAGATFACFQSLGISPDSNDFEKKWMLKLVQLVRLILLILCHVYCLVRMLCVDLVYIEVLILQLMRYVYLWHFRVGNVTFVCDKSVSVSFVNTDWNWLFKISDLSTVSVTRIPSRFRGATPELSVLMLLM